MKASSQRKKISMILFLVAAVAMFGFSTYSVSRADGHHARVLFFYNEVKNRHEGVLLAQKRQNSRDQELRMYLYALLSPPSSANFRPLLDAQAQVHSIFLLPGKSVIVLEGGSIGRQLSADLAMIEYGLNFNFPALAPFKLMIESS